MKMNAALKVRSEASNCKHTLKDMTTIFLDFYFIVLKFYILKVRIGEYPYLDCWNL